MLEVKECTKKFKLSLSGEKRVCKQEPEVRQDPAEFTDMWDDRNTAMASTPVSPTSSSAFSSSSKTTVTASYTCNGILATNKLATFFVPLNRKERRLSLPEE